MPPICVLCDSRFEPDEQCGLIQFTLTEEQNEFNTRFRKQGFTGHPEGFHWFCKSHYDAARTLSYLHDSEALSLLRIRFDVTEQRSADTAALLTMLQQCEQLTVENNKEVNAYIQFKEGKFIFTLVDQLNWQKKEHSEITPDDALEYLRRKVDDMALFAGRFKPENDHQRLALVKIYPYWVN